MINVFNLLILFGLMIPNVIYALSYKDIKPVRKVRDENPDFDPDKEAGQENVSSKKERTALEELLYAENDTYEVSLAEAADEAKEGNFDWVEEQLKKPKKKKSNRISDAKKKARMRRLNALVGATEAAGRIACMILMIVPFGVLEFEFSNKENFIIYTFGNIILLLANWIVWSKFLKKRTFKRAIWLSVLSALVFLLTGLTLDHWWLALAAALFGACRTGITLESVWEEETSQEGA